MRVVAWVRASHAGPTAVVTLITAALSATTGSPLGTVLLVTGAELAGQLSIGWSNDAVDAERDLAVGRRDKPVVAGHVSARALWSGAAVALGLCAVLSLLTGPLPGVLHLIAVGSAWAYNLRLKSTAWSWAPYAVSFALLPAFVVLATPGRTSPPLALLLAGGLLGVGAHLANTLPDLEDDVATGVRGLPHRWGRRTTAVVAPAVLAAGLVAGLTLVAPERPVPAGLLGATGLAVAAAAAVVGVTRPRSRAPFVLTMLVAVLCVIALLFGGRSAVGA